jgi:hypothetical protein
MSYSQQMRITIKNKENNVLDNNNIGIFDENKYKP